MSAFIALRHANGVELMADGAVYEQDGTGTLVDVRRKIEIGKFCAVTTRGNADAGQAFARVVTDLCDTMGFDAAMERVEDRLKARSGKTPILTSAFELVIVGISESRGPIILYATTVPYKDGVPAWQLIDAGHELAAGPQIDISSLRLTQEDMAMGLSRCGLRILDAMRQVPGITVTNPEHPPHHGIGGQVDHAVITPEEGTMIVTGHVWPDEVGKKISPMPDPAIWAQAA